MPAPLANWNRARDAWETSHSHIDLFSELSAVWSETWPTWGMTRGGVAYALPTSAPPTAGSGCSSSPGLLPTPNAIDGQGGPKRLRDDGRTEADHGPTLRDVAPTLPTPTSRDWKGPNQRQDDSCLHGALLPTPRATDGTKGGPNQRGSSGDLMLPSAVMLLPTPSASVANDGEGTETWLARREAVKATGVNGNGMGMPLTIAVQLLPTPTSSDGDRTSTAYERGNPTLIGALLPTPTATDTKSSSGSNPGCGHGVDADRRGPVDWGQYAPAVHRWERVLGRVAPPPTQQDWATWQRRRNTFLARRRSSSMPVGRRGRIPEHVYTPPPHRLSPSFVEWLMGLPAGWVTDVPGVTRNEALKALGNGVVPQQAAAALRLLLPHASEAAA